MNCMEQKLRQELKEILEKYTKEKDNLIPILNDVQVKYGYIPQIAQSEISEYLSIPMAEIYGVITFYSRFTLKPKGKYAISVCLLVFLLLLYGYLQILLLNFAFNSPIFHIYHMVKPF